MGRPQIVMDTDVLVSGLRSRQGAAFRLLALIDTCRFDIHISVPLVLEYEDAVSHLVTQGRVPRTTIDPVLAFLYRVAKRHPRLSQRRQVLRDPQDDLVLEVATNAGCEIIVTSNVRGYAGVRTLGIRAMPPATFLREIGDLPWVR
jgi:putative PIN family toxin of toxin-antitoxin system